MRFPAILLLSLAITLLGDPAAGQPQAASPGRSSTLVTADSLKYDQNLGIITAEGNVELAQEGRTLLANLVTYSERDGRVVASGNVSVMQDDGTVLFAEYMELSDGMKNGFVRDMSMLLEDNSRAAAASAERIDGNRTVMHKAVYTSCALCPTDPKRAPLWQVKGDRVEHDMEKQEMRYRDAVFEVYGFPVAYSPYFSHPDPTVLRRSGFLSPSVSSNNFYGSAIRTPYYYVIDDSSDLTITPQYSLKEGPFLMAEYAARSTRGEFRADGSITQSHQRDAAGRRIDEQEMRGHFRADGIWRNGDDSTYGFNIFRASDDTYLSRYQIPNRTSNALVSRAFSESINNRHFFAANAYSFQDLRPLGVPGLTPLVVPMLDYSMISEPGSHGGRWAVDANMASLYRAGGTDTRRVTSTVSWSQPYFAPTGEVYTATAALKTDAYWVNELNDRPFGRLDQTDTDFVARAIPVLAFDWRYPLVSDIGTIRHLMEPIVGVVLSPYGGDSRRIPNEDSLNFEFDETNIFGINRFPGADRHDSGPRLNVGGRTAVYGSRGGYSEILVAESFRARKNDSLDAASGAADQISDLVTRITVSPTNYLHLVNRMRIATDSSLTAQRNETTLSVGPRALRANLTYADIKNSATTSDLIGEREAISGSLTSQFSQFWSLEARHIRDLGTGGGALLNFLGLRYTDECFDIMFYGERTFTINRDIQPSTTFGLRFRIASFN